MKRNLTNRIIKIKMVELEIGADEIAERLNLSLTTVYRRLSGKKKAWNWKKLELEELKRMFEEKAKEIDEEIENGYPSTGIW